MNMDIPEVQSPQNPSTVVNYITKAPKSKKQVLIVDWFSSALIVIITIGIIATYFVSFNVSTDISIRDVTVNTLWFAVGTFSIGALTKKMFRRKGEKTEEYQKAENLANEEIEKLCNGGYSERAEEYCEAHTKGTILRYRKHRLSVVGLSYEDYEEEYLGKSFSFLWGCMRKKKISFLQLRAIQKCNRVKTGAYQPTFILSYNSSENEVETPSNMYNVERTNAFDSLKSFFIVLLSAFGVGFMFSDVVLNFSILVLFEAIIKLIMIGVNIGFKATTGWKLACMEIKRNYLRASEAKACVEWAKKNPVPVEVIKDEERKEEPYGQIAHEEQRVPALPVEAVERQD